MKQSIAFKIDYLLNYVFTVLPFIKPGNNYRHLVLLRALGTCNFALASRMTRLKIKLTFMQYLYGDYKDVMAKITYLRMGGVRVDIYVDKINIAIGQFNVNFPNHIEEVAEVRFKAILKMTSREYRSGMHIPGNDNNAIQNTISQIWGTLFISHMDGVRIHDFIRTLGWGTSSNKFYWVLQYPNNMRTLYLSKA